jgi:hypothetical protein
MVGILSPPLWHVLDVTCPHMGLCSELFATGRSGGTRHFDSSHPAIIPDGRVLGNYPSALRFCSAVGCSLVGIIGTPDIDPLLPI